MSNRNNDVFRVLPVSSTTILPAGQAVDNLAAGQLGIFDATTHLSVVTAPASLKEFYFAVGNVVNGVADPRFSAGQLIQRRNVVGSTQEDYTAGSAMKVNVGNYKADADTEYGIRIEFRNAKINRIQGYNQFSKAFLVKTPVNADCTTGCGSTDANVLTQLFIENINADISGLVLAQPIARQALTTAVHGTANYAIGAVMTAVDVEKLITFNKTALPAAEVFADIQLVSQPLAIGSFCQVNLQYYKLLETVLIVSLIEGFGGSGATTVNAYPVYAQGTGINVQQKEYHASGWAGSGPYKLSGVTGTAKGNIVYIANASTNYDQYILEYNQSSESGWQEYSNPLSTIFAFPTGGTNAARTALSSFLAAL